MKRKARLGLLPLYLKLYDDTRPETRKEFDPFLKQVTTGLEKEGVEVVPAGICRLKDEFQQAFRLFEQNDVDIIVTLHLAYSPSLEAIDALCNTDLPILMLDTTMDFAFGQDVDPKRLMFNHGIHGVQDLASMLRRRQKEFHIAAGHVGESDVLRRAAAIVKAAYGARALRETKALRIGESFKGMGDFHVNEESLKRVLGISVEQIDSAGLAVEAENVTDNQIDEEVKADRKRFKVDVSDKVHRASLRVGLALRRRLDQGGYGAFSMNFLAFESGDPPIDRVPFLEASKAMARGIGYAGEGDVLTASLVGALSAAFGRTTFTEIFCPDWKGNTLFLSHMGEINPDIAASKPVLCEKDFPYTPAENPAVIACSPTPGAGVLVNISPGPDDSFRIIAAQVEVLKEKGAKKFQKTVRGWIRPTASVAEFLEAFSVLGGTHHSALVLGDATEAVAAFAAFAGLECCII